MAPSWPSKRPPLPAGRSRSSSLTPSATPQEAANAANKVIFEDKVHYIIGEVCSSASIPVSEIAEANGVLQISPTSTNPAVTINEDGSNKEYVFRACFLDPFQGEVWRSLAMELGAKTAAVLFDVGNDYVKGLAEYFKASFEEMGGTVVCLRGLHQGRHRLFRYPWQGRDRSTRRHLPALTITTRTT